MFGNLGLSEIIVIFGLALLVFGPRRLPEIAATIGRTLAQLRRQASEVRDTVEREVRAAGIPQVLEEARQVPRAAVAPLVAAVGGPPEPPPPSPEPPPPERSEEESPDPPEPGTPAPRA